MKPENLRLIVNLSFFAARRNHNPPFFLFFLVPLFYFLYHCPRSLILDFLRRPGAELARKPCAKVERSSLNNPNSLRHSTYKRISSPSGVSPQCDSILHPYFSAAIHQPILCIPIGPIIYPDSRPDVHLDLSLKDEVSQCPSGIQGLALASSIRCVPLQQRRSETHI